MNLRLRMNDRYRSSKYLTVAAAITVVIASLPTQQLEAATNNSGRYVVVDENGMWRALDDDTLDIANSVFYPSWYLGVDLSQTKWDANEFESKSSGAGLVLGNHFHPRLRWELRHRYQDPETEFTGVAGQSHTLSSLALDYIVSEPADGFSPVVRAGVAKTDGDNFASKQSDITALVGIGLQWRQDRWFVRMMVEQAGEDQHWGALSVAGYLGGGQQVTAAKVPVVTEIQAVKETSTNVESAPETPAVVQVIEVEPLDTEKPEVVVVEASDAIVPTASTKSCGKVFSMRVMNDIAFVDSSSDQLTARSVQQLAQIGASYARRDYVAVQVDIRLPNLRLAERRAVSVVSALDANGELDGRIFSRAQEGAENLMLSMKDMRRCN